MKKVIISIVIVLMCILTVFTIFKGIHLGNFVVLGISEIKEEDEKLEKKITEATKLASTDYPNEVTNLNKDIKEMKAEKQNYEDMVSVSSDTEISTSIQKQKYTIEKLWSKIGKLATEEGLTATFTLTKGSLEAAKNENFNYYNIEFAVEGSYVGVALYLSELEDDSELGFRIEDFNMVPIEKNKAKKGDYVRATFKTKDIAIEGIKEPEPEETEEEGEEKEKTTNTTSNPVSDMAKELGSSIVD